MSEPEIGILFLRLSEVFEVRPGLPVPNRDLVSRQLNFCFRRRLVLTTQIDCSARANIPDTLIDSCGWI